MTPITNPIGTQISVFTMVAPSQINVYASLPQNVVLGDGHSLPCANWCWVHCLSLPLEELNTLQLSQRPYKWFRYAIGVVVGAEGVLSASCNSHDIVDYDDTASLLTGSADLYSPTRVMMQLLMCVLLLREVGRTKHRSTR